MRVLIVSHIYAPEISPRAFRWAAIAEHWTAKGHEVGVLCARKPGLAANENISGVDVTRVGGGLTERVRAALTTPAGGPTSAPLPRRFCGRRTMICALKWVHDHTWKKLYWPDYACLWLRPAVRAAEEVLASRNYDALITVSDPFTCHLVGLRLKRANPSTPWLVDLGDPFCFRSGQTTNNQRLYRRRNYAVEREVFRRADWITLTCEPTRARYAEIFSESADKIAVVPPLLSAGKAPSPRRRIFADDGKIRMVYVGVLYRTIRDPVFLLDLFGKLSQTHSGDRLELHLFGASDGFADDSQRYERLKVFWHGLVERETAIQATREADVLVNIGNTTPYQLPSKVVDYASAGKPILNLAKSENDSSSEFFKTYPAHLNLLDAGSSPTDEQVALTADFVEHLPPQVDPAELETWLDDYRTEAVAGAYERLIRTACC
ncbi:MAG: hypothetical protein A2Z18_08030 [Armatimonadetes bacterium RBG_16_58_9]|nr:MAG: hypothetical protein A2Z18_08030 [Armatimonadetes bacterium RBG_16_58_9]